MNTRLMLTGLALLMSGFAGPSMAQTLEKVTSVIPDNSVFILNWNGANDAGIFKKHGIDLTVDARPFAGFLAAVPAKQTQATTYSGIDAILKMNEGIDLAVIGGGLTAFQDIYVPVNSPIKTIADLKGKKFGVWSTGAGAFKAARASIADAAGFDVLKDTKIVQLAPPALFKLLERGEIDAMINISSFSVEAGSQPDKYRTLFSPNEYWKKKTGYPIVWSAPLIAWKDWVDQNRTRAKNFSEAVQESFRWVADPANFDAVVKKYGVLAGVTTPAAAATYKKWLAEGRIFLSKWDQKVIDAQWQFLEMAKQHGVIPAVPDKATHALNLEGTKG